MFFQTSKENQVFLPLWVDKFSLGTDNKIYFYTIGGTGILSQNMYEKIILDETENVIYLSEIDTYRLVYMNRSCRELLGIETDEGYLGRPCYEVLQGFCSPCAFCTNPYLKEDSFYTWKCYNRMLKRHFTLNDKILKLPDNRRLRLEIATDITETETLHQELHHRLNSEKTLLRCIQTLAEIENIQTAIHQLLKIIAGFYGGERAYIFEIDYAKQTCSNTYEWCSEGITREIDNLQQIPLSTISGWLDAFRCRGEFCLHAVESTLDKKSSEYRILAAQNIDSLIAAPLMENDSITGFIGVDNPAAGTNDLNLLTSVSYFIVNDIQKRKMTARLKKMSYIDLLTGLFNRNKYTEFLQSLGQGSCSSLGIVYMDLNGLKVANDTCGHKYGDHLIKKTADLFGPLFNPNAFRIGGDEFVAVCPDMEEKVFHSLIQRLRASVEKDPQISVSIGSVWNSAPCDPTALISRADHLMYLEKQAYYKKTIHVGYNQCSGIAAQLLKDLSDGRFIVHLQPRMELQTGKVTGAEALIRRKEESGSLMMPGKFLPLYESEGLVHYIDIYVLETVCKMLRSWRNRELPPVRITVNLSSKTFLEPDILLKVQTLCEIYRIPPEYLCLKQSDLTEKLDSPVPETVLEQFLKAGFFISANQESTITSRVLVERSLLKDSGNIHEMPTAEEIETQEQISLLGEAGYLYGQGFYYSSPVTIQEFEQRFLQTSL